MPPLRTALVSLTLFLSPVVLAGAAPSAAQAHPARAAPPVALVHPAWAAPSAAHPAWAASPVARSAAQKHPARAALPAGYGWPVSPPRVTRRFDPPPQSWLSGHRGVDLAAAPSAPVRAAGAGTVVFAGEVAGRGVVSVAHPGGLRTTYEPVTPTVAVGARVALGDQLGTLATGHPGCPAPACLHWGLRRDRLYLDPLALLGLGRVRLLPLNRSP